MVYSIASTHSMFIGKDLTWYAKEGSDEAKAKANADELARIKEAEAEAMAIALYVILSKCCNMH